MNKPKQNKKKTIKSESSEVEDPDSETSHVEGSGSNEPETRKRRSTGNSTTGGDSNIDVEAEFNRNKTMQNRLENTQIIIHGNLKKPIMALTLATFMDKLVDLVDNPQTYLSETPLFFSCLPVSEITDLDALEFKSDIHNDQLQELYNLRETFENQFKKLNSLIQFTKNVNEKSSTESNHLPNETLSLESIKNSFQSTFIGMQHKWLEIMQK